MTEELPPWEDAAPLAAPPPPAPVTREEVAKLAKEYKHYYDKMPTDPYRRRWEIIAKALDHFSKHAVDEAVES
jgi:hypothetical protein